MENHRFVAIVDDDESVRRALRRLLRAFGLEAETFGSGQDFLDSLPARRPDCAIVDLNMPGLNGLDVQRRLADAGLGVPTIIITADDQAETGAKCLAAGAVAYLRKPLEDETLLSVIARATDGGRVART
jgi:FixJ family two-component response regulator